MERRAGFRPGRSPNDRSARNTESMMSNIGRTPNIGRIPGTSRVIIRRRDIVPVRSVAHKRVIADDDERLLTMSETVKLTTISRSQIYKLIAAGAFPRQVQVSKRRIAFRYREIMEFIRTRPRKARPK
jgi:predicted DNA-binding transcriptional regulator AlpA